MLVMALSGGIAYAQAQTVRLDLGDFTITPSSATVRAGERVTFQATNTGQRNHDVRVEGPGGVAFEVVDGPVACTGSMPTDPAGAACILPGQSATKDFTFTTPGTYQMWCPTGTHRQQGMEGTITVLAAGAPMPAAPAAAPARPAAPAQMPGALPRTGEPAFALLLGGLAAAGAGLVSAGLLLRRRRG
jgi:LPXTG-motif cell wall-anchored protein